MTDYQLVRVATKKMINHKFNIMKNSNKFIDAVYSKIDIEPLELDRFFHEGFYEDEQSVDYNLETLMIFIRNRHLK